MEVIAAAETWLDGQPSELFLSGLQKLEFGRCSLFPSTSGKDLSATQYINNGSKFLLRAQQCFVGIYYFLLQGTSNETLGFVSTCTLDIDSMNYWYMVSNPDGPVRNSAGTDQ